MRSRALSAALLGFSLLAAPFLHAAPTRAATSCVDVALVLSVDSSASVSQSEYFLQRNGIAAAFRDPAVLDAFAMAGRVAVSIIFWGSEGLPKPQSPWMLVDGRQGAEAFARAVEAMPRGVTGDTGLGAGLQAALGKLATLDACAIRRVVNVSGDGEETRVYRGNRRSLVPSQVRDIANRQNVEINALAITDDEKDLPAYYAENVITGPDAFVMEVGDYDGFAQALRRKLIREVGPRVVSFNWGTPNQP